MEKIRIKPALKTARYLQGLNLYEFPSLLHLVFELLDTYTSGRKELEDIELLLDETGYANLRDIPEAEIESIKQLIIQKLPDWKRFADTEYIGYKLMAAIGRQEISVFADDQIIQNPELPITLSENSIIAFIHHPKISQIQFKTL